MLLLEVVLLLLELEMGERIGVMARVVGQELGLAGRGSEAGVRAHIC